MTMQPIETMPKDFVGFCWVACEDKEPCMAFADRSGIMVGNTLPLREECHEWFLDEELKWWAPAAAPPFPAVESDGHKCPHCGGTDLGGLFQSFWVPIDEDGGIKVEWRELEGESEIGEERLCYGCGEEFV